MPKLNSFNFLPVLFVKVFATKNARWRKQQIYSKWYVAIKKSSVGSFFVETEEYFQTGGGERIKLCKL